MYLYAGTASFGAYALSGLAGSIYGAYGSKKEGRKKMIKNLTAAANMAQKTGV